MTKPWKHQTDGLDFIDRFPGAMLAFDMGTGKSKVVVDYICQNNCSLSIIVCPLPVLPVWPHQFELHATIPVAVRSFDQGSVAKRALEMRNYFYSSQAGLKLVPRVFIINYEAYWRGEIKELLLNWGRSNWISLVVLDESHRIKAPGGKASWMAKALGRLVPKRICLTGTPMPHSPLDVYAQYRFLEPRIFGTNFQSFKMRYADMGGHMVNGRPVQVVGYRNLDELNAKFYSRAMRVRADDVLDLPEAVHTKRTCELCAHARKIYDKLEDDFVVWIEQETVTASNALVKLLRLHQIAGGWITYDERDPQPIDDGKLKLLMDLLEDFPSDEPVVIFCRFRAELAAIRHSLACFTGLDCLISELSGNRNELADWQAGHTRFLIANIHSGKEGVDMSRAKYAIYYSLDFSLGAFQQSQARIRRPGQKASTVFYYYLITKDTVDGKILRALQAKRRVVESVLENYSEKVLYKG